MRIAVCDDEKTSLETLISGLEEYCIERKTDFDYVGFSDYEQLLPRIGEFDGFILDYMTPGMDGLTFAQTVRDAGSHEKPIIFVTSYPEIVYDSFKVRAFRFLVKPVQKDDLFEALDACLFSDASNKTLSIKTDGAIEIVHANSICCVEAVGRDCVIATEQGEIFSHKSISWFEDELGGCGFFRVHRSFLVNLRKIVRFNKSKIELTGGKTVEISTRKYKDFCQHYLEMK